MSVRAARLAAVLVIGDDQRLFVQQAALDARPGAHVGADLLAGQAAQQVGGEGQGRDGDVGHGRGVEGHQLMRQGRRVGEVEDPGAAGAGGDHHPGDVGRRLAQDLVAGPGHLVHADARGAVALEETLHGDEEIGPDRLRAGVAAPHAPGQGGDQEQSDGRQDQQPGEVVDLLRPDLDEEEIEPPAREIDQHRLVGRVRPAVPADPGCQVVDGERHRHDAPFEAAEAPPGQPRINLYPLLVEGAPLFLVDRFSV